MKFRRYREQHTANGVEHHPGQQKTAGTGQQAFDPGEIALLGGRLESDATQTGRTDHPVFMFRDAFPAEVLRAQRTTGHRLANRVIQAALFLQRAQMGKSVLEGGDGGLMMGGGAGACNACL